MTNIRPAYAIKEWKQVKINNCKVKCIDPWL